MSAEIVSKACSDYLKFWTAVNRNEKLKASHAREIVAAFFGFKTHAALLATKSPLQIGSGIELHDRLTTLTDLPPNIPNVEKIREILAKYLVILIEE